MKEDITRREAIKKLGKYAAFTALGTMIILNPKKAQAQSGGTCGGGHGHHGGHGHGGWKAKRTRKSIFK